MGFSAVWIMDLILDSGILSKYKIHTTLLLLPHKIYTASDVDQSFMDLKASTILQYLSYGKSELLASMENFFFPEWC